MSSKQIIVTLPTRNPLPLVNVSPDCVYVAYNGTEGVDVFIGERGIKGFLANAKKPPLEAWEEMAVEVSDFKIHVHISDESFPTLTTTVQGNASLTEENRLNGVVREVVVGVVSNRIRTSQLWAPSIGFTPFTKD